MKRSSCSLFIFWLLTPVLTAARLVYRIDSSGSAHTKLMKNGKSEFVGKGKLKGPEDIYYDKKSKLIYTGCSDGWIKRVTVNKLVNDTVVEDWINTGGRPLGLAKVPAKKEIIVADAYKGLLRIKLGDGKIEVLTDQANGTRFKLTDGVCIAKDGKIYFTDASSKYDLKNFMKDIVRGKPHGRLLCYDPQIRRTQVLADQLFFPNGVAISPDEDYLLFSESPKNRCKKYYLKGKSKGQLRDFIELPGYTDNIHLDEDGNYWVASTADLLANTIVKYHQGGVKEKKGGIFKVNSEGKKLEHYSDVEFKLVTSAVKIGNYLYSGSLINPFLVRLPLI